MGAQERLWHKYPEQDVEWREMAGQFSSSVHHMKEIVAYAERRRLSVMPPMVHHNIEAFHGVVDEVDIWWITVENHAGMKLEASGETVKDCFEWLSEQVAEWSPVDSVVERES